MEAQMMINVSTIPEAPKTGAKTTLLAAGGLVGSILASTCCILPLVLLTLGVSGAWIGSLTALSAYQPYFLLAALGFLGAGFWRAYQKDVAVCAPGSRCAVPKSRRTTKALLWLGTVITAAALAVDLLPFIG